MPLADDLFLGHDLLAWLVLAMGAALAVGNIAALVRPPARPDAEAAPEALRRRAMVFAAIGAIAAVWALATLLAG
jgi:hypothetical protein